MPDNMFASNSLAKSPKDHSTIADLSKADVLLAFERAMVAEDSRLLDDKPIRDFEVEDQFETNERRILRLQSYIQALIDLPLEMSSDEFLADVSGCEFGFGVKDASFIENERRLDSVGYTLTMRLFNGSMRGIYAQLRVLRAMIDHDLTYGYNRRAHFYLTLVVYAEMLLGIQTADGSDAFEKASLVAKRMLETKNYGVRTVTMTPGDDKALVYTLIRAGRLFQLDDVSPKEWVNIVSSQLYRARGSISMGSRLMADMTSLEDLLGIFLGAVSPDWTLAEASGLDALRLLDHGDIIRLGFDGADLSDLASVRAELKLSNGIKPPEPEPIPEPKPKKVYALSNAVNLVDEALKGEPMRSSKAK